MVRIHVGKPEIGAGQITLPMQMNAQADAQCLSTHAQSSVYDAGGADGGRATLKTLELNVMPEISAGHLHLADAER